MCHLSRQVWQHSGCFQLRESATVATRRSSQAAVLQEVGGRAVFKTMYWHSVPFLPRPSDEDHGSSGQIGGYAAMDMLSYSTSWTTESGHNVRSDHIAEHRWYRRRH